MRKENFFRLHIKNLKYFCFSQFLFNKSNFDGKHMRFQSYIEFKAV